MMQNTPRPAPNTPFQLTAFGARDRSFVSRLCSAPWQQLNGNPLGGAITVPPSPDYQLLIYSLYLLIIIIVLTNSRCAIIIGPYLL
jgi:hypothetical protein